MQTFQYDTLNIRISSHDEPDHLYDVEVSGSGGHANGSFTLPFDRAALKDVELRVTRGAATSRRLPSEDTANIKRFGGELFTAVFGGRDVRDVYRSSRDRAEADRHGLRLTLQLSQAPDLMEVPWEFLFDDTDFIANSWRTPVVRKLDLARPAKPLQVDLPLRVLAVVSDASDLPKLETGAELAQLRDALKPLVDRRLLALESSPAVLSKLLDVIDHFDPHVLHFAGHGAFSERRGDGILGFVDTQGESDLVDGDTLATLLRNSSSLRLALVNACEGSRSSRHDPLAGVAGNLIKRNVPAVIAMQYEITDNAAILFATEFYEALAEGQPVDAAVGRARMELFANKHELEWGTPVVFLQTDEARIFDVREPPPQRPLPWWRRLKPPRPRIRRVSAAVAGLLVAVAATTVAWKLLHGSDSPPPKPSAAARVLPGSIDAGAGVFDAEYGFGALWVSNTDTAFKLLPSGLRGKIAYDFNEARDVLVAAGFIWIATADGVVRVDKDGRNPTFVALPGGDKTLAAGGDRIWVLLAGKKIVGFNPEDQAPHALNSITVDASAVALAADDTQLYVGHTNGTMTVVEPSAKRDDDQDPAQLSGQAIQNLAAVDGVVYAFTGRSGLVRWDSSGAVDDAVEGSTSGAGGFAVDSNSIWMPYPRQGVVRRYDARSGQRIGAPLKVGSKPLGIMLGPGRVWVMDEDGTVRTLVPTPAVSAGPSATATGP